MRPVILNTDIGTDVDDLLALVVVAKASELRLIGVTTTYGDTVRRAQIAGLACKKLGLTGIPIIAGTQRPISQRQVFWAGIEGEGLSGLEKEAPHQIDAPGFLVSQAEEHAGFSEILAIGPLTNVALALKKSRRFADQVRRLYIYRLRF